MPCARLTHYPADAASLAGTRIAPQDLHLPHKKMKHERSLYYRATGQRTSALLRIPDPSRISREFRKVPILLQKSVERGLEA